MLVKKQLLEYDANGNMLAVKQEISDPDDPLGNTKLTLRQNIWDEENRLRAVDLNPEAPDNKPEVAAYTYDAAGQRIVKYLPGRLDAFYSAKAAGSTDRLEAIIYPSPLLTVKTKPLPEGIHPELLDRTSITTYTKHYYMGTERISSALGTMKNLGVLCEWNFPGETQLVLEMNGKVQQAQGVLIDDYITFEKIANLPAPFLYGGNPLDCRGKNHDPENYHPYWYHPDHLGSSNYITNLAGEINQHMEYLPFGETLVEEHLNSYNSPFKLNGQILDAETGNYYLSQRYFSPKYNLMLSVDPMAEKYPGWSPYAYAMHRPTVLVDPTGMSAESPDDWVLGKDGKYTWDANVTSATDVDLNGREYIGKSTNNVAAHYAENNPVSSFFGGSPEFGDTSTWPGEITTDPKTWVDSWRGSDNIFAQASYETANSFSIVGQSMNPFDNQVTSLTGEGLNGTDRSEYGANVAATLLPVGSAKIAVGPTKQWLRIGASYSRELSQPISQSIRWGASPARNGKYLKEIPSTTFRQINQWLRSQKLPGNSWRVKDAGHFHIKK